MTAIDTGGTTMGEHIHTGDVDIWSSAPVVSRDSMSERGENRSSSRVGGERQLDGDVAGA